MARVFYFGARSRINLPPDATISQVLAEAGGNTGNLLIGHAIRRHIKAESLVNRRMLGPEYIAKNFDYVVLGASNFLCEACDLGEWAEFLERVKLPCTIIGLGAQAPQFGCRVDVAPGTLRLVKLISERSTSLGVRGPWTASILAGLGVKNVRVIGCPAMFWTCEPELKLRRRSGNRPLAVALNGSALGVARCANVAAAKEAEARLARWSLQYRYPYVLQNEECLLEIASAKGAGLHPEKLRTLMGYYGMSDLAPESFIDFVRQNTVIFFQVAKWHAAMRRFDFVLGSRFHGCLVGLLAGVPAFIFAADARTRELCELLQIPHRLIGQEGPMDIEAIYESMNLDSLEHRYRQLYQNYREFLEENGIEHCLVRAASPPSSYMETIAAGSTVPNPAEFPPIARSGAERQRCL